MASDCSIGKYSSSHSDQGTWVKNKAIIWNERVDTVVYGTDIKDWGKIMNIMPINSTDEMDKVIECQQVI